MNFDLNNIKFSKCDIKRGIRIPKKLTPKLAEEIGIHIGDGSLNKYNGNYLYSLRGHLKDDEKYFTDFLNVLYSDLYGLQVNIRKWLDVIGFQVGSEAIGKFKNSVLGLPLGPKKEINIPDFIIDSKTMSRACMRGLFDTDGCLSFEKKSRKKPYYPRIFFSTTSKKLSEDVVFILKDKLDFNLSMWFKDYKKENWSRLYCICVRGKKNLFKWFKLIGSDNPKNISKFWYWKKYGYTHINTNNSN